MRIEFYNPFPKSLCFLPLIVQLKVVDNSEVVVSGSEFDVGVVVEAFELLEIVLRIFSIGLFKSIIEVFIGSVNLK